MWRSSECDLYCVSTTTRRKPAFTRLESAKSIRRKLPPNGTAGLARSSVSGARRFPSPPASTIVSTFATSSLQRASDDPLRLVQDPLEPRLAVQALGVDLVDVLRTRRARREPAVLGDHLEAADRRPVPRRLGQHRADRLAGQPVARHLVGREPLEHVLLLRRGRHVGPPVDGLAEPLGELRVELAGVLAGRRLHLRREQARDEPILVGRPCRAVAAQERRARALLPAEADRPLED